MAPSSSFYRSYYLRPHLQPPSETFLDWLRAKGAPEAIIAVFREGTLREDVEDYPLLLLSEGAMMDEGYIPIRIAIENGLLVFASSMGCGDHAAIDLRGSVGTVGYISHETMQYKDVRKEAFWPVTISLDKAANLIAEGKFPSDYHDAVWGDDPEED